MIKIEKYENDVLVSSKEFKPEILENDKNEVEEQRQEDEDREAVRKPAKTPKRKS